MYSLYDSLKEPFVASNMECRFYNAAWAKTTKKKNQRNNDSQKKPFQFIFISAHLFRDANALFHDEDERREIYYTRRVRA